MSEAVKEYGRALADLAAEEGIEERVLAESRMVRSILAEYPAYVHLLSNPEIPKKERTELLAQAFGGQIHPHFVNFLKLITERGYACETDSFLAEYESLYCQRHKIATAYVQSAVPLSDEQKDRLCKKLAGITGKTIELSCRVDPSLIGGIRLYINNTLLEGSVRARLDAVRASLASLTL